MAIKGKGEVGREQSRSTLPGRGGGGAGDPQRGNLRESEGGGGGFNGKRRGVAGIKKPFTSESPWERKKPKIKVAEELPTQQKRRIGKISRRKSQRQSDRVLVYETSAIQAEEKKSLPAKTACEWRGGVVWEKTKRLGYISRFFLWENRGGRGGGDSF